MVFSFERIIPLFEYYYWKTITFLEDIDFEELGDPLMEFL